MTFMLAVLGSVVFWIMYAICSVAITGILVKHKLPDLFDWMKTGEHPIRDWNSSNKDMSDEIAIAVVFFLFWTFILIGLMIWYAFKLVFGIILWPAVRKVMVASGDAIPEITIEKKEK